MRLGLAPMRLTIGALFMGHGLQKLAGWFGGPGLENLAGGFEQMGLRPGKVHAAAAGAAEAGGGMLLVAGRATPLAGATLTGVMTTAIDKVHWQKGVWNQSGGFEYNAVLIASLFALTAEEDGLGWALAQLAAGVAGGLAVSRLELGQMRQRQAEPTARFRREDEAVTTESIAG